MKIALFGATGGTGTQLLQQGLEKGYKFKLLMRSTFSSIISADAGDKVEVIMGDATNADDVSRTIKGCDAVVVSFGKGNVCSQAQPLITESAEKSGCKRMVVVTSLGVGDSYQDLTWFTWAFVNTVISGPIADKNIQESHVMKSAKLDWTIVRPGGLTNGDMTGKYRVAERGLGGGLVSRADVAHFILNECLLKDKKSWLKKSVTIVY